MIDTDYKLQLMCVLVRVHILSTVCCVVKHVYMLFELLNTFFKLELMVLTLHFIVGIISLLG